MPCSRDWTTRGWTHVSCTAGGFFSHWATSVQLFSHIRLWGPMDCSMSGFPVHHQLLEPSQTHVHHDGDAIQPSHPLSSPSPPAFSLPKHQDLFQWVDSSHQGSQSIGVSESVLLMNIQDWYPLELTGCISLQSKGFSGVFPNAPVQKHQFFGAQLYGPTLTSIHDYW